MQSRDLKTLGYVLKRTNYAEADRILQIITPEGKISAIAKGVRREKSKLAGGIEMFSLVELNLHQGKSELFVITGAKMLKFYSGILKDLDKTGLAGDILKKISKAAEHSDNPDYFEIVRQSFLALGSDYNLDLIETWFLFNLVKASGEEINLFRDVNGEKLDAVKRYDWDESEMALRERVDGVIGVDEIKIMRMILTNKLAVINKIKGVQEKIPRLLKIIKAF
ncbi:DNA repair protein RecO [Candidatus Saccharibacteria bacterium]|nr:DNA repair protein RecO [Candidatus Saccharibacteria bacterium]